MTDDPKELQRIIRDQRRELARLSKLVDDLRTSNENLVRSIDRVSDAMDYEQGRLWNEAVEAVAAIFDVAPDKVAAARVRVLTKSRF